MSEYTIVGIEPVIKILKLLRPYLILKKSHVLVALEISSLLREEGNLEKFVKASELADSFAKLNYSKKRANTSGSLKEYLRQHKLYPRND